MSLCFSVCRPQCLAVLVSSSTVCAAAVLVSPLSILGAYMYVYIYIYGLSRLAERAELQSCRVIWRVAELQSCRACRYIYIYIYIWTVQTNRCRVVERAKTNRCNHPITNICIETAWSAAQNSFCDATANFLCCQGRFCTARADLEGQTLTFHHAVVDSVAKPGPATSSPAATVKR